DGEDMRDEDVPGLFLNEAHLRRWRGNALALMGDGAAVDDLCSALERIDSSFTRAEAGLRIDLAQAYPARGKLTDARHQARQARLFANRTGSVRHRRRIDQLALRLGVAPLLVALCAEGQDV